MMICRDKQQGDQSEQFILISRDTQLGGVAEWTYDFFRSYRTSEELIDPVDEGGIPQTSVRGWITDGESKQVRSAVRRKYPNINGTTFIGFRVCRVLDPTPAKPK